MDHKYTMTMEQEEARRNHIFLLFGLSEAGSMKVALSRVGRRHLIRVLSFNETFSAGPLCKLDNDEGCHARELWFQERFPDQGYHLNPQHKLEAMIQTLKEIPEDKKITIWCGDNSHDQTGLRFALSVLSERKQPVHVINPIEAYEKLPGITDQFSMGLSPQSLGQLPNEAVQIIIKNTENTEPLTSAKRKQYELEWQEISNTEDMLRVWSKGQLTNVPETYYDEDILSLILQLQKNEQGDHFVNAGLIAGTIIGQWNLFISTSFIEYRFWRLISEGKLLFKGIPYALHLYFLRIP
ncbi:DUF1835 domain-containing protein [Paenibacillus sp. FSL K6-2859]|uniref:DUF1835 domain-containing protein n=1 Tax=Paenibacillus sp. FSL K6-2859 TaxID=2921482 RepID=UPI0030F8894B